MFPNLAAQKTCVAETNFAARKTKNAFASRAQILRPKHMFPSLATPRNIKRNIVSATIGPFIREKIRRALHKTRAARINGTKQAFAFYFRHDLHKTRLILEQNFWLFLFCPRLK